MLNCPFVLHRNKRLVAGSSRESVTTPGLRSRNDPAEFRRDESRKESEGTCSTTPPDKEMGMPDTLYPRSTKDLAQRRHDLAPEIEDAFKQFSNKVFEEGALTAKTKQLIAVAVAHVTQCPYCIRGHTKAAKRDGATAEEIMEAIWVAAEMRAGGAYAHSALALDAIAPTAPSGGAEMTANE
jgi:AhpD family alkylhydroperoxidase